MAGNLTGLAYAGISNAWDESAFHADDQSSKHDFRDLFEEINYEKERRQRMLDRIRRDEQADGIYHHEHHEKRYDHWVETNEIR